MDLQHDFPFYSRLTPKEQELLTSSAIRRKIPKGTILANGSTDCLGFILLCTGQLRAYIISDDGREVTIYRMFDRDVCLFSASCMIRNMDFDITISAEKDCDILIIPPLVYKELMNESLLIANYTNEQIAARLSDVIWLMEQIMWKSFDKRLADFLLKETEVEHSPVIRLTHEAIANHMGSAREVVTRMLRYFQSEGMVRLARGSIEIKDIDKLKKLIAS